MGHSLLATPALLAFCMALTRSGAAGKLDIVHHPLRAIRTETLVYSVRAGKGLATFDLGRATFVLTRAAAKGQPPFVVRATAKGGVQVYPCDAVTTVRLRQDTLAELSSLEYRVKPYDKSRWLRFHDRGVDWLKHRSCDVPALCRNPAHLYTHVDGTKVHVAESEDPAPHVWSLRERRRTARGALPTLECHSATPSAGPRREMKGASNSTASCWKQRTTMTGASSGRVAIA